ncbi:MAG: sulfotransferase [Xanthomonadales bacterium]|nr:sulfotransferase [Xanthomonadales bacterium]
MNNEKPRQSVQSQLQQAAQLMRSGQNEQGMSLLSALARQHPEDVAVLRMQGISLAQMGQPDQAAAYLARAAELQPRSAMAASDHASVLLALNRFDSALASLRQHEQYLDVSIPVHDRATYYFNLGRACKQTGQAQEAVRPLLNTLEIMPQHYAALIVLGDVYKALGQAVEAGDCYRRAIALNAADGTGWWSLSNLKAGRFSDEEFAQLARQYDNSSLPPRQQIPLRQQIMFEFALANAFDQRQQTDQAFRHYQAGNCMAHQREPWDSKQFRHWLRTLQNRMLSLTLPERPQRWNGPRPIFVISLPRSGSTLVEQVLAAHSEVTAASELPWIPQLIAEESARKGAGLADWIDQQSGSEWLSLGQQYLQKCSHWTRETAVFTDKLPGNMPYIGAILAMLPQALVVGVCRDAMDVCWSCYRQLLMGGSEFIYDPHSLADYWQDFEDQMDFWQERAPDRVMSVQYEQLVNQPEVATRRLLDFAGLPFEPACLSPQTAKRAVNTASAMQVREAIHARGVGHWQRYAKHLGELQQALQQAKS